jgi:hypothetical protein
MKVTLLAVAHSGIAMSQVGWKRKTLLIIGVCTLVFACAGLSVGGLVALLRSDPESVDTTDPKPFQKDNLTTLSGAPAPTTVKQPSRANGSSP